MYAKPSSLLDGQGLSAQTASGTRNGLPMSVSLGFAAQQCMDYMAMTAMYHRTSSVVLMLVTAMQGTVGADDMRGS